VFIADIFRQGGGGLQMWTTELFAWKTMVCPLGHGGGVKAVRIFCGQEWMDQFLFFVKLCKDNPTGQKPSEFHDC